MFPTWASYLIMCGWFAAICAVTSYLSQPYVRIIEDDSDEYPATEAKGNDGIDLSKWDWD